MTSEVTADDLAGARAERLAVPVSDAFDSRYLAGTGRGYDGVVVVSGTTSGGGVFGTGSLLSTGRHVLTAAHVVDDILSGSGAVRFETTAGVQSIAVSTVMIHPDYVSASLLNDIAILELESTAPGTADRYDIYRGSGEIGQIHTRVGYGRAGTGASGAVAMDPGLGETRRVGNNVYEADGEVLQSTFGFAVIAGTTLIFDFDNGSSASDALGVYFGLNDTGLGSSETNSTSGDSGGPVFINGQVAGITSYGFSPFFTDINFFTDSSFGEISGDTRVSAYASWIDGITGSDSSTTSPPATSGVTSLTAAADLFVGSSAGDIVRGGSGSDTLSGQDGDDILYGNKEVDLISGGAGADTLYGGQNDGPETENGGVFAQRQGVETLYGGDGDDVIYGNHGADGLFGEDGNDTMFGGQDSDTLSGGGGNDVLFGNRDNDVLRGDAGDDTLYGGAGDDTAVYAGNSGSYTFRLTDGQVFISGSEGEDLLDGIEFVQFADTTSSLSSLLPITSTSRRDETAADGSAREDDGSPADPDDMLWPAVGATEPFGLF